MMLSLAIVGAASAQENAASFDGVDDWLDFGTLNPGASFTLEAWVRFDAVTPSYYTVFEVVDLGTGFNTATLLIDGVQWNAIVDDLTVNEGDNCGAGNSLCTAVAYPAAGSSHHVALVVEQSVAVRVFVDGVLAGEAPIASGAPVIATDRWSAGIDTAGGDALFGVVDEVRIWSTARTAAQLACTRDWQLRGNEPGLYRLYDLDVPGGSVTFTDRVSGGAATAWNGTGFVASPFALTPSQGRDVPCLDYDGDGFTAATGDCNEGSAAIRPGAAEVPADGIDQDCSGGDRCYQDLDDDGFGTATLVDDNDLDCANASKATSKLATDCVDTGTGASATFPGSAPNDGLACYRDADGDDYGDDAPPTGAVAGTDCDDTRADSHPGAAQVWYDGIDQPCTGAADDDRDGDGFLAEAAGGDDCDDLAAAVNPGASELDGNGIDDDCSGEDESGDTDGDGVSDALELFAGTDYELPDSDGDGIDDATELGDPTNATDTDNDDVIDAQDTDSDGDGVTDLVEGTDDGDCDGTGDWQDVDPPGCDTGDTAVDTDPVDTDPVDTDPVDTDPADTDPVDTDPDTDPGGTDRPWVAPDTASAPAQAAACGCGAGRAGGWLVIVAVAVSGRRRRSG